MIDGLVDLNRTRRDHLGKWKWKVGGWCQDQKAETKKNEKMKPKICIWLTKVSPKTWSLSNFSTDFSADFSELWEVITFPEESKKSNKGTESWKSALGVPGSGAREKSRREKSGEKGAVLQRISPEELTSAKLKSSSGKSGWDGAAELQRRYPKELTSAKPKSSLGNNSSAECWAILLSEKSRE